jgi:phenolic acid decarboxylase
VKPRKKYRPKPVLANPVAWVIEGVRKLDHSIPELQALNYAIHSGLLALRLGKAQDADLQNLISASNMVEAIAATSDIGTEYKPIAEAGKAALKAICLRPSRVARGPELTAINELIELHDELLRFISLGELTTAVVYVKQQIKQGAVEVI